MLAVDVPSAAGGEQRLFLEGDENIYNRGGVLNELRDPFLRVMGLQVVYRGVYVGFKMYPRGK